MKKTLLVMSLLAVSHAFGGLAGTTFYINNKTGDNNTTEDDATVYAKYTGAANYKYETLTLKAGKTLALVPGDAHSTTIQTMTLGDSSTLNINAYNRSASGKTYLTDVKLGTLTMNSGSNLAINTATTIRIESLTQGTDAKIKAGRDATVLVKVTPGGGAWDNLEKIELTGTGARKGYTVQGNVTGDGLKLEEAAGNVIELNDVTGILYGSANTVVAKDIILTNSSNAAANFSRITGDSYTFNGAISGDGNFVFSQAGKQVTVTLNGDLSGWSTSNDQWGGFRNAAGEVTVNMNYAGDVAAAFNVHSLNIGADATLRKHIAVTNFSVAAGKQVSTTSHFAAESVALANGAQLTLDTSASSRDINSLTLGTGSTITLSRNGSHTGKALVTTSLTVSGNATMNADLVMNSGRLTIADGAVLTMGCDVTIGNDVTVVLTDAMVYSIMNGGHVEIFSGVDHAELNQGITFLGTGDWADYVAEHRNEYMLTQVGDKIYIAPEPATATMSLLALAGLCARRRRH